MIVHFDGVDKQFVAAFRKDTGEIAWTAPRSLSQEQNAPHKKAFSTPLVVLHEGAPQLISPGADEVVAYDPASGSEIWRVRYEGYSVVPQPAFGHGRVYVDTGYIKPHLLSIRLGGRGDITESHVDWDYHWQVPANPSPLLIDDHIFMVSDWGNATWLDVHSGEDVWRQRLRDSWRASPVYADGRIYLFSVEGKGLVLEAGGEYKEIAVNALEAEIRATPAFADGAIYVRGQTDLYRLDTTSDTADSSGDPADGDS